jgi:hypothetical protein
MAQDRLERCQNGCCFYVNGKAVTKRVPASDSTSSEQLPRSRQGQRNAILETIIGCRSALNSTNYQQQTKRIEQRVKNLDPSADASFDSDNAPNFIRFRIKNAGTELTKAWPHLPTSEVAGCSDDKLDGTIESLTSGLLRRAS